MHFTVDLLSLIYLQWRLHTINGTRHMSIHDFDRLVQERRNSSALAMELRLSCINPWVWSFCCHRLEIISYHTFKSNFVGPAISIIMLIEDMNQIKLLCVLRSCAISKYLTYCTHWCSSVSNEPQIKPTLEEHYTWLKAQLRQFQAPHMSSFKLVYRLAVHLNVRKMCDERVWLNFGDLTSIM